MPWRRLGHRYPGLRSFLGRRFDADSHLGLHLTLGMLLGMVALSLFAVLACAVVGFGVAELTNYDARLNAGLADQAARRPELTGLLRFITDLGDFPFLALVSLVVTLVLVGLMMRQRRHQELAALWVIATLGVAQLNWLLKELFQRPRPDNALYLAGGWSFPSGHSMGSLVVYGMLAYLLLVAVRGRWAQRCIVAGVVVLVAAIGFSRAYLSVHWPTDVVGGYAAGTAWLALCVTTSETLRRRANGAPKPPVGAPATVTNPPLDSIIV
jgi:undecaprenyl-diphosphatase